MAGGASSAVRSQWLEERAKRANREPIDVQSLAKARGVRIVFKGQKKWIKGCGRSGARQLSEQCLCREMQRPYQE